MADVRQPQVGIQRVFISSTSQDLQAHREAVHDVLERMGQFAIDMAQFGAQGGGDAIEVSLDKVASADIYIGIVAWRYGYVPPRRKRSVMHLEYLEAKRRRLPCFLFLADSTTERDEALFPPNQRDPDHAPHLTAFRAELQREHVVDFFTTPDDLAKKVATALHGYLLRQQGPDQADLAAAEAQYRQQVVAAYRTLRFSGFEQSDLFLDEVPLEQVFVRLRLTVEQVRREPEKPEAEGKKAKGKDIGPRERVVIVQEPITLAQALSKPLLLVGEPGAGKSTLLRWLAVTFAQGTQRHPERVGPEAALDRLPVLIELGRLPAAYLQGEGGLTPNWQELIPLLLTEQQRFADMPPTLLRQTLAKRRGLLLFDGLDEVANRQARARIARSLAELPRLLPGVGIVIGSRPAGLSESESVLCPTFQRCEIQRFTPEDLQRFFQFWYALDHTLTQQQQTEAAAALVTQLQATPGTLTLATTPLLATVLLLIWRREEALPERRADLYARCCRALVETWEQGKDGGTPGTLAQLEWEQHMRLLSPIAYAIHQQEQRTTLSRQDLLPLLEQSLLETELSTDAKAAAQAARDFLRELGLRSGLLQYLGDEQFGFPHLTFQEYLAARYIAAQPDPTYVDMVMEHLHEAWWQEVQLLTVGVLGSGTKEEARKASDLILTILDAYRPPSRFLRTSRFAVVKSLGPGRWLPAWQLSRRLAWILRREEQFALLAAAECAPGGLLPLATRLIETRVAQVIRAMLKDPWRRDYLQAWLNTPGRRLGPRENRRLVQVLLAALLDTDWDLRRAATEALGQVGARQPEVVEVLLATLHDPFGPVRWAAAEALGQVGTRQPEMVEALLANLHDTDWRVRLGVAAALGQIGAGQPRLVATLLTNLHDAVGSARQTAPKMPGQVGAQQPQVVEALLVALNVEDRPASQVKIELQEIVRNGRPEVVEALRPFLNNAVRLAQHNETEALSQVEFNGKGEQQVVLVALLRELHCGNVLLRVMNGGNSYVYVQPLEAIRKQVEGRPLPNAPRSVQHLRTRRRRLQQMGFWLLVVTVLMGLGLLGTWLTGVLDANSFLLRFLGVVAALLAGAAGVTQIVGWSFRDFREKGEKRKQRT